MNKPFMVAAMICSMVQIPSAHPFFPFPQGLYPGAQQLQAQYDQFQSEFNQFAAGFPFLGDRYNGFPHFGAPQAPFPWRVPDRPTSETQIHHKDPQLDRPPSQSQQQHTYHPAPLNSHIRTTTSEPPLSPIAIREYQHSDLLESPNKKIHHSAPLDTTIREDHHSAQLDNPTRVYHDSALPDNPNRDQRPLDSPTTIKDHHSTSLDSPIRNEDVHKTPPSDADEHSPLSVFDKLFKGGQGSSTSFGGGFSGGSFSGSEGSFGGDSYSGGSFGTSCNNGKCVTTNCQLINGKTKCTKTETKV